MQDIFCRSQWLLGKEAIERLKSCRVAVFGVGGVGSACVEALARGAVGSISLFDSDRVSLSNINRQLVATTDTVGKSKVSAMAERIKSINPDIEVFENELFYSADNADEIDLSGFDCIVDAIDSVSSKIELICRAKAAGVKIISCMGTGNKLDASAFLIEDIYKTSVCPLARVMRRELSKRGIKSLTVLYSKETPIKPAYEGDKIEGRAIPASVSFVPPIAGMLIAGEVILNLIEQKHTI